MAANPADPHNPFVRQVIGYWEMAAAMVLHGAVSAELFVDCNDEGFFLLAKFAPILDDIRERNPTFLQKTTELVKRFTAAAARYEAVQKNVEAIRSNRQSGFGRGAICISSRIHSGPPLAGFRLHRG